MWYLLLVLIGLGVAQRGIVVAVLAVLNLLAVLRFRTWVWTTGALVVTVLTELLVRASVLPDIATFADFGFVYLAEVLRPLVAFSIWAESFALLLLFLLDPPTAVERRRLLVCFGMLIAIQLSFVVMQAVTLGIGDLVKGTTNSAHTVAELTGLGSLALITWGYERSASTGLVCLLAAVPYLAVVPLLAEAKQVIFALPVAILVLVPTTRQVSGR
jgi:hypothetical protein